MKRFNKEIFMWSYLVYPNRIINSRQLMVMVPIPTAKLRFVTICIPPLCQIARYCIMKANYKSNYVQNEMNGFRLCTKVKYLVH